MTNDIFTTSVYMCCMCVRARFCAHRCVYVCVLTAGDLLLSVHSSVGALHQHPYPQSQVPLGVVPEHAARYACVARDTQLQVLPLSPLNFSQTLKLIPEIVCCVYIASRAGVRL